MGQSASYAFISPIALAATPAVGDTIVATINGVEYEGEWDGNSNSGGANLYDGRLKSAGGGGSNERYVLFTNNGAAFFQVARTENEPPTTDYTVTLALYREARRVTIPQDYVEGLSDLATDVETAKSTANSAIGVNGGTINKPLIFSEDNSRSISFGEKKYVEPAIIFKYKGVENGYLNWNTLCLYDNGVDLSMNGLKIGDGNHYSGVICNYGSSNHDYLSLYSRTLQGTTDNHLRITGNGRFSINPDTIFVFKNGIEIQQPILILPSSTAGSTKKFKITVDDSGALTATEVTT